MGHLVQPSNHSGNPDLQENAWPLRGVLCSALKRDICSHAWTSVAARSAVQSFCGLRNTKVGFLIFCQGGAVGGWEAKQQQSGEC